MSKKKSGQIPRINSTREPESLLNEIRLDRGLFVLELCEKARTNASTFNMLVTGELSPFYELGKHKGMIRPYVKRLLSVLNTDIATAFPRYVCEWKRLQDLSTDDYEYYEGLTRDQVIDISHGSCNIDVVNKLERDELLRRIFSTGNTIRNCSEENMLRVISECNERDDMYVNYDADRKSVYQVEITNVRYRRKFAVFALVEIFGYTLVEIQELVNRSSTTANKWQSDVVERLKCHTSVGSLLEELEDTCKQQCTYNHL